MVRYRPQKSSRRVATDRKKKDLDEVYNDLHDPRCAKNTKFAIDYTLPGLGQFYCVACSRHFIDGKARDAHLKTKIHKRRVKILESGPPYTGTEFEKIDNGGAVVRQEEEENVNMQ